MAQTVKIPDSSNPFVVKINNDEYSYKAGTEQSVPDEVAAVIASHNSAQPIPDKSAGLISWNDLKDRPFYETAPVETVMLPETTVTINLQENVVSENFPYSFEIGKNYTIIFDGVETEFTAYDGGNGNAIVGYDAHDVLRGTGFYLFTNSGAVSLITRDSAFVGQHTISIKGSLTDIVKIPDKYLNRHTHILGASFWETKSKSELIDIVNQFNAGDVFIYQYEMTAESAASLLLSAAYNESSGFDFVYMDNYAIRTIHGDVGNWTTKSATIAYS